MLESTDFACTLKETKTTIPISRTPKPISGFGLKPGRYRLSAVKVAGFDPLDANHAASTGVGSFPVLDRTCKQGKENTGMRDNQTTRRMPMIVTAMACATASMLAGLTLAPSAMAAGATITDRDKVDFKACDFTVKKVDAGQREHAAPRSSRSGATASG